MGPMLELEFAEATDRGPVREHNEDFVGHSLPPDAQQARARADGSSPLPMASAVRIRARSPRR